MKYSVCEPITIDGKNYYSVKQFGIITSHSEASINHLIKLGNKFRKLMAVKFTAISNKPMIPASELTDYVFTQIGRKLGTGSQVGYKFKEDGTVYEVYLDEEGHVLSENDMVPRSKE